MNKFIRTHWILILLILALAGVAMMPHRLERLLVYFPTRDVYADPRSYGLEYEELQLVAEDGVRLHGWFIPFPGASRTILILHGNGGNIADRLPWMERLHALGAHLLIFDYRGYGRSAGKPFEAGVYRDAQAAYDWWAAREQGKDASLVLLGESLGGAVAVHLAAKVSPDGLVLQSTFTSAWDMAKTMMPIGLLQPLMNVHFDSAHTIAGVRCPKLMLHGTGDAVVPFRLGEKLFELAPPPKEFCRVPGAGHNDLVEIAGEEYFRRLQAFLVQIP